MNFVIKLPEYWPPEKVDFLHDFVSQLYEAIWDQYGQALCEYWEEHPPFEDIFADDEIQP
jgi:hypothetical protein